MYRRHPAEHGNARRKSGPKLAGETNTQGNVDALALYVQPATRPDITWAVNRLCHSTRKPTQYDWRHTIYVLKYLKGTHGWRLTYGSSAANMSLVMGFCDAGFASMTCPGRSTGTFSIWRSNGHLPFISTLNALYCRVRIHCAQPGNPRGSLLANAA
eukprot:scaffold60827_cov35-Prasinocladus_malaysianus.AAC.2